MKNLYTPGILAVLLLLVQTMSAQEFPAARLATDKPQLFQHFPQKLSCNANSFLPLFDASVNDEIIIEPAPGRVLKGQVIEKVQRNEVVLSLNIRLSNFPGALLNLSRITLPFSIQQVRGRILHPQSGDVLLLTQEKGNYFLVKQSQTHFLAECPAP